MKTALKLLLCGIAFGSSSILAQNNLNNNNQGTVPVQIVAPVPIPVTGGVSVTGTSDVRVTNQTPIPVGGTVQIGGTPQVQITNSTPRTGERSSSDYRHPSGADQQPAADPSYSER